MRPPVPNVRIGPPRLSWVCPGGCGRTGTAGDAAQLAAFQKRHTPAKCAKQVLARQAYDQLRTEGWGVVNPSAYSVLRRSGIPTRVESTSISHSEDVIAVTWAPKWALDAFYELIGAQPTRDQLVKLLKALRNLDEERRAAALTTLMLGGIEALATFLELPPPKFLRARVLRGIVTGRFSHDG